MTRDDYLEMLRKACRSELGLAFEFPTARAANNVRKKLYALRIKTGIGKGLVMSVQRTTLRLIPQSALKSVCDGVRGPLNQRSLKADEVARVARDTPRRRTLASRSGTKRK